MAASDTVISAQPASIAANGRSVATITVQAKDVDGNNLTKSQGTVALATTAGTLGPVIDNLDGTYAASLTSATAVETATISGTIAGAAIGHDATVDFALPTGTFNVQIGPGNQVVYTGAAAGPDSGTYWNPTLGGTKLSGLQDSDGLASIASFTLAYGTATPTATATDQGFDCNPNTDPTADPPPYGPDSLLSEYFWYNNGFDLTSPSIEFSGLKTGEVYDLYFYGYKDPDNYPPGVPVALSTTNVPSGALVTAMTTSSVAPTPGDQYNADNQGNTWNVITGLTPDVAGNIYATLNLGTGYSCLNGVQTQTDCSAGAECAVFDRQHHHYRQSGGGQWQRQKHCDGYRPGGGYQRVAHAQQPGSRHAEYIPREARASDRPWKWHLHRAADRS